jgi:hypothetical protein
MTDEVGVYQLGEEGANRYRRHHPHADHWALHALDCEAHPKVRVRRDILEAHRGGETPPS